MYSAVCYNDRTDGVTVCSTTGNGDPPENSDWFWRTVKKRTAKDNFLGVRFCVLALGDTNYDKFCHMGKSIDKRCSELGGVRVADLVCADEATNLEEQVTLWKNQTISTLQIIRDGVEDAAPACPEKSCSVGAGTDCIDTEQFKQDCCAPPRDGIPPNVQSVWDIKELLSLNVDLSVSPDSSQLPRARKAGEGSGVEVLEAKSCAVPADADDGKCCISKKKNEWSVENPFFASVNYARWLTPSSLASAPLDLQSCCLDDEWEAGRDVALVELNINRSDFAYLPGDAIAICAPNPPELVRVVLSRLEAAQKADASSRENCWVRPETVVRKSDGEELSLGELFTYRCETDLYYVINIMCCVVDWT